MKQIIIIRGPLGVGKSTVSELLAKNINAEHIFLDKIIKDNELEGSDGIPLENFLKANEIIFNLINKSKKSFIIDGCFYYQEQIDDLQKKFKNKILIFSLLSDIETCISRDSKREKVHGEDSARFVHMVTSKVKVGYEIDNTDLSPQETANIILEKIYRY